MHFPFIDHAHPTSTGKHTPYMYIHCAIKLTHTLHPCTVRSSKHTLYIHALSDQANTHSTSMHCPIKQTHLASTVQSSKHTPYIHYPIKLTHTLHPLCDQANAHPTSTVRSSKHTPYIHCPIKQTHPTSTVCSSKHQSCIMRLSTQDPLFYMQHTILSSLLLNMNAPNNSSLYSQVRLMGLGTSQ